MNRALSKDFSYSQPTQNDKVILERVFDALDIIAEQSRQVEEGKYIRGLAIALERMRWMRGSDYTKMTQALEDDRFEARLNEVKKSLSERGEKRILSELNMLHGNDKRLIVGLAQDVVRDDIEPEQERPQSLLLQGYRVIVQTHPTILNISDDVLAAQCLGNTLRACKNDLAKWKDKDTTWKMDLLGRIWAGAYPEEDVPSLSLRVAKFRNIGGVYISDPGVDSAIMADWTLDLKDAEKALFIMAHEYNHRRQRRLADAFERGEVEPASPQYFKARAIKIGMSGGYLYAPRKAMPFYSTMKEGEYLAQPLERDANDMAMLSMQVAEFSEAEKVDSRITKTIGRSEKYRKLSDVIATKILHREIPALEI